MRSGDNRQSPPESGAGTSAIVGDELLPGTIVKGSYRVLEFVGEGGAGAVYAAEHVSLGHRIAIKTLFGKFVRDDGMRRRFIEEAIIQANLSHANIVKVIDVLDEPPLSAIFMEYVEGSSLDKHLSRRDAPDTIGRSAQLFVAMLDAMSYAHAQGVVHRDIKPANVLLARGGDGPIPKVTDFGIAKVLSDHRRTETGTAMGTVYYAAPEQLTDAKSVDHRADIYSLGCTFYEMLTLELPFDDATMFGVMQKHVQAPRPDPARINPAVPRDVANLVMRAMAVRPDHRFQTCAEFASELRRVLGSGGLSTSGSGLAYLPPITGESGPRPELRRQGVSLQGPSTPADPRRSTGPRPPGRVTKPGTISTPPRPVPVERNPVSLAIWAAIALLSVGLVVFLLASGRGDDAAIAPTPTPDAGGGVARVDAGNAAAVAVAEAAGSGEGSDPGSDVPAQVPADARPDAARVAACVALAERYLDFDPLGEIAYADALADLERNAEPCREVLERNATDRFERAMAFMASVQTRAVHHDLLARRGGPGNDAGCENALVAVTEAHRGLRHLGAAAETGELLEYEVMSLGRFHEALAHLYVGLVRDFPSCPFVPIPGELLGPEAAALAAVAAPPAAKPTLVADGSGWSQTELPGP